ncbi:MAG: CvpA family protein [Thermomicrobiales bacterium]
MTALALTVLLAVLWLAFVALGYWHGGWRQVVMLAGMLLSYAVLSEWAAPNGRDLAARFHWSLPRATTAVGLVYLLGGTLIVGLLGSFALERPYPLSTRERQCGAVMGVLNGGLLLALILRTLRSYAYVAGGGAALRTSALSRFLIESVGYILLVALVLGFVAVVAGLTLAQRRHQPDALIVEPAPAPVIVPPPSPQQTESQPVKVAAPAPLQAPPRAPTPAPVYASEPIIDWPASPPPGTRIEPNETAEVVAVPAPHLVNAETMEPEKPEPISAVPVVPQRVEPPMWYPVAELVATRTDTAHAEASSPPTAAPTPPPTAPPPVVRPTTPPPGALHPAFIPPMIARPLPVPSPVAPPPTQMQPPTPEPVPAPEDTPPVVREVKVATDDALPVVREIDVATQETPPPVVREVDVTTDDVPLVAVAQANAAPPSAHTSTEHESVTGGETMNVPEAAPAPLAPAMPDVITETSPIPVVMPPPLPPLPARRAASPTDVSGQPPPQDEPAKARAGFARVAVARQAGQRPDPSPASPPPAPAEPEPPQPPLPTGPRVHACPTCGYPVRDHARYCPNCGSRQRP